MEQATQSNIHPYSHVIIPEKLISEEPKIYNMFRVKSVHKDGLHVTLEGGKKVSINSLKIPTQEIEKECDMFNNLYEDAENEFPSKDEKINEEDGLKESIKKIAIQNFKEYKKVPNIQNECDKILKLMEDNQEFLCKKPNKPFLAYLMLRWQNLFYAGRTIYGDTKSGYQCQNNPKYEFEDMAKNDKNERIIYDAWGAGVSLESILPTEFVTKNTIAGHGREIVQLDESDFDELSKYFSLNDDFTKLLFKKNKTMNDWYDLLGNPNYRYHSLYGSKHSIDDHLLCTNGNGYDWNKEGFLCNDGPSGEDESDFGKFPMLKGHSTGKLQELENKLNEILFQPHVQECLSNGKVKSIERAFSFRRTEILRSLESNASSAMIGLVYGSLSLREEHPIIIDFATQVFNSFPEKDEIIALNTRYQELWSVVREKMTPDLSFEEKDKISKKYTTTEQTKIGEKLSSFCRTFTQKTREEFKKIEISNKDLIEIEAFNKKSMDDLLNSDEAKEMFGDRKKMFEKSNGEYYPLSNFSRMVKIPDNAHESYKKAAVEICLDIVKNAKPKNGRDEHSKESIRDNIVIAKQLLVKLGHKEYAKDIPKIVDKYQIFKDVKKYFAPIAKEFYPAAKKSNYNEQEKNTSNLHLNDTKENEYADDNIYCYIKIDSPRMPKGMSNSVESLTGYPIYTPLKNFIDKVKSIEDVKAIFFYYEKIDNKCSITMEIKINGKQYHFDDTIKCEQDFVNQGFALSNHSMALELDEYILVTKKSETLGSKHPNNTDGKQYYSNSQYFSVYDKDWNSIDNSFNIDERGFNTFSGGKKNSEITTWLNEQFKLMKSSNKNYGTYDSSKRNDTKEGKKHLYSHDFMLWLKEHQMVKA